MLRITKSNWQEPTAYASAVLAVALGVYWGATCDPAWISRAGSVVIVCGVLLAASRKIDLLQAKATDFLAAHKVSEFNAIIADYQNSDGTPIREDQATSLRETIYREAQSETEALINQRRRVFKLHEVAIVVAGTIINGFGEWFLKLALCHAT
jgi:glycerol dehydrogenase-like iron-containing ADH family enzyme